MIERDPMYRDAARDDLLQLVDACDRPLGEATKEQVHREGLLHRAFSVVLTRATSEGTMILLAQRALGKYHSGGLWANSCCSHPRVGETLADAARRRVTEELGCGVCDLHEIGSFVYRAEFASGLIEFEYDHVLMGTCVGEVEPNLAEVGDTRWWSPRDLAGDLASHPERYCAWAYTVLSLALQHL